jgi:hypothetical protein
MANEVVRVGVANDGELTLPVSEVKEWEPKKINYMGDVVYFKAGDTFYSMKTVDFKQIFEL